MVQGTWTLGAASQPAQPCSTVGGLPAREPAQGARPGSMLARETTPLLPSESLQRPLLTKPQCQLAEENLFKRPLVHLYRAIKKSEFGTERQ